ncbi:MAG TPA: hypothetical protein VFW31_13005 [Candidatus Angelobacter sp.]|nr:hypothetical protein [Candidatus Angelobacter sp.]
MMKTFLAILLFGLCGVGIEAQQFTPPPNNNAALRYWAAFAEMKDQTIDDATSKLMDEVLNGSASFDEQRLGPILDENSFAVRGLQRATTLPECNWGLDYSLGSAVPLAHLPKARVLAKLNALYGARQLAKGDADGAVTTWLAGLRFAQCVGAGVGLIGNLSAKPAFAANLHLLTAAAQSGAINSDLHGKIRSQLRQLPPEGLNWIDSIKAEEWACEEGLKDLAKAPNFQETYKEFFGSPVPQAAHRPTAEEIAGLRALMADVIAAFQLPPAQARERLGAIMARAHDATPAVQAIVPNFPRLNDSREKLIGEKDALLKALK